MTSAEYLPTTSMMPKRGHPSKLRSDGRKSFKRSPKAQSNISHLTLSHPDWYPGSINDSPTATNPIISGLRALTGRVHSLIDNWQERRKPVWTDRYTLDLPWQISRDASELDYLLRTNRKFILHATILCKFHLGRHILLSPSRRAGSTQKNDY
jgi:hypothetical protein